MVKCTEFKHHPVKLIEQELFFNDSESAYVSPNGRGLMLLKESGSSACYLFFDKASNLVFMPGATTQGIVIDIASKSLKWINGKNMTCNLTVRHP